MKDGDGLTITVKLYAPFKFSGSQEERELEVPGNLSVGDLLERLEDEGVFSEFARQAAFAIVDNDVAENNYILQAGQIVKILPVLAGG